jgi:NADH dehydrogenase FAD-containing subunit
LAFGSSARERAASGDRGRAGFGGLAAAKALKKAAAQVILIDRTNHHVFQPLLLYQVAISALRLRDSHEPAFHDRGASHG